MTFKIQLNKQLKKINNSDINLGGNQIQKS